MNNITAIVGRPNVGKSTLFNRLIGKREAIVDEVSGVTRDRIYGHSEWTGIDFSVIDTGGYVSGSEDVFEEEIRKQVLLAIDEADVILFMVDVKSGITGPDERIAKILRKTDKKILLVVNKVDNSVLQFDANEFYKLGFGDELFPISATNGSGTGDLLDALVNSFSKEKENEELDIPKFSFVGRPNVGKSSTVNALVGEERNIVTEIAGTTRDSIHTRFQKFGYDFIMVDTAGVRKKAKVHENLEFYSVMRAVRAIEHSDICVLIIDATLGMQAQDVNIFHIIERNKKGVVIMVNKWDLIKQSEKKDKEFIKAIKKKIEPFNDVPVVFSSALTKQRILKVLKTAVEVYENRKQRISTSSLNNYMQEKISTYPPPSIKGKFVKIKYVTQLPTATPAFAFYCNLPQYVKAPYKRYLENQIRKKWNFTGVPVQIYMRKK